MAINTLFLGQQLAEQSIKLGALVGKMTTMIDNGVDLFCKASDEVQKVVVGTTPINNIELFKVSIKTFMTGSYKLKFEGLGYSTGYQKFIVKVNGIEIIQRSQSISGSSFGTYEIEFPVAKGDVITFEEGLSNTAEFKEVKNFAICYTEINKPNEDVLV
ncbi:MAG: hypothetical protein N4A68_07545 [Maledivibacter sp.]|jgi:hypothetical protein|nr:hypothetical protein [Maledivibacter sp.]